MDTLIIFGAKYLIYVVALIAACFLLYRRSWRLFIESVVAVGGVYVASRIAGLFYDHVQPFAAQHFTPLITHGIDNSFPSDHTAVTGVVASIVFLYNRTLGIFLWILALMVGISRVYAGVHYPVDILAGAVLAVVVAAVVHFVFARYFRHSH